MAILDPKYGYAIDRALPAMLEELSCRSIPLHEAALRLGQQCARQILRWGEDPSPHLNNFYRILFAADYAIELYELGFLEDDYLFRTSKPARQRELAITALTALLSR